MKPSLFVDDVIYMLKMQRNLFFKKPSRTNKFSKVSEYKLNKTKNYIFTYS